MRETEVFTELRPALFSVAYHMLGSAADAEDVVQEAYLRWRGTPVGEIESPQCREARQAFQPIVGDTIGESFRRRFFVSIGAFVQVDFDDTAKHR